MPGLSKESIKPSINTKLRIINQFKGFTNLDASCHAVVRPENVSITKSDEQFRYPASVEEGIVEHVLFRGKEVELGIRIHDTLLKGTRKVEDVQVQKREKSMYVFTVPIPSGKMEKCPLR